MQPTPQEADQESVNPHRQYKDVVLRDYAQSVGAHVRPTRLKFTQTKQTTRMQVNFD